MTISVAMAVYNGARYLREQLESIARQERTPDELVVSDNCSTDDSPRIVEDFAALAHFPVRLHINDTNVGVSENFARAIAASCGDVICLADCDDVWYPTKLRRIEEAFSVSPTVGLVFSDADVVDEHVLPMGYRLWRTKGWFVQDRPVVSKGSGALKALFRWRPAWVGHTMAFRAELKSLILPMPDLPSMQRCGHDFWIALLGGCVTDIGCIFEPQVAHRRHAGQVTAGEHKLVPLSRLRRARKPFGTILPLELGELVCQRLSSVLDDNIYSLCEAEIKEWLGHMRRRSSLTGPRLTRLPAVLEELLTGRYYRFSNGWLSAVRDIYSYPIAEP
jgi:glycosyltransferase involved in cell wall biosynthesis